MRGSLHKSIKKILVFMALTLLFSGLFYPTLAPVFEAHAQSTSGGPSGLNAPPFDVYNGPGNSPDNFQTCSARFTSRVVTADLIESITRPMPIGGGNRSSWPQTGISTSWLQAHMNQSVPVIEWFAPNNRPSLIVNGGHETSGGGSTCSSIPVMVPTGTNTWEGPQFYLHWMLNASPIGGYYNAEFQRTSTGSNTEGNLTYIDIAEQCSMDELYGRARNDRPNKSQFTSQCSRTQTSPKFVVSGSPSANHRVTLDATWEDAATINLRYSPPLPPGQMGPPAPKNEVYRMPQWREWKDNNGKSWSLYFLWESELRPNQEWGTGRACDNPIQSTDSNSNPIGDCRNSSGASHCVPFIAVGQNINISRQGSSSAPLNIDGGDSNSFSNRVGNLGSARAIFYDYGDDCAYLGNSDGSGSQRIDNPPNEDRSRVWFYRSEDRESLMTVFQSGHGNEQPFVGVYSSTGTEGGAALYEGGEGCAGEARVTENRGGFDTHPTTWVFYDSCDPRRERGKASVLTLGGSNGAEHFNEANSAPPSIELPDGEDERLGCSGFTNPLTWIICPVVLLATGAIEWLDSGINSMLTINAFDEGRAGSATDAYHQAWGAFRIIALALIVVAALIMVIAQAAGIEIMDAYTIRKVLPRLLLATIGITLSWQLALLAINISNDLGQGIRSIIYAPFGDLDATIGGGTNFVIALLAAGALAAFGALALLSFALTGVIAVLIAFALLAFREIAVIALTIIMPIAIACAILPGTQKFWDLWRKSYMMLLAAFVLIMAFVAVGRVFASTTATAGATHEDGFWGAFMQIIAIIAYFAPYFMIPFVFKMSGGLMAAAGGFASQGFKRLNTPLTSWRQQRGKEHREQTMAGNNWLGGLAGGRVGGIYRRVGMAKEGGLSLTERGRKRYQSAQKAFMLAKSDEALKRDNGRAAGNTDANEIAINANSAQEFINAYAQRLIDGGLDKATADKKAREALGTFENGYGLKMGTAAAKLTAWKAHVADNTAYAGYKPDDSPEERLRKYRANMAKMYEHGASLMNAGIIDASDAAGISKSNKARGDFSSIGYGSSIKAFEDIAGAQRKSPGARGEALFPHDEAMAAARGGKTIDALMEEALTGTNSSTLVHGRHEQVSAFVPLIHKKIRESASAVATATDDEAQGKARRELAKYTALAANIGDAISQGHMVTGEKAADMFAMRVPELDKTIQEIVAEMRGNADFQKYRREYTSLTEAEAREKAGAAPPEGSPGPTPPPTP